MSDNWTTAVELGPDRSVVAGSFAALCGAIGRGADLRVYTEFIFEEHIQPGGDGDPLHEGLIREVIDFRESILVHGPAGPHAAGITTLRQPLHPPFGFNGIEPKMAYFMYTMEGLQGRANLLLDPEAASGEPGDTTRNPTPPDMAKMGPETVFDARTTGPSRSFVYSMERYRYIVRDDWEELLSHEADGRVRSGSIEAIRQAQIAGREFKVGVRGLLDDLGDGPDHEVFTLLGSGFLHERMALYNALTHPLVRVRPAVPLVYGSRGWDVAWVHLRTDGAATVRVLDPFTRRFADHPARFAIRWFAR